MKKWCVFLLSCFIISGICYHNQVELKPVFEEENYEFVQKKIDVKDASITSKNITSLLTDVTLRQVTYEVPKLYQNKLGTQLDYYFRNVSIKRGLQELEETLSTQLKEMGKSEEVERIYFYGVKINAIEVYGKSREIEALEQSLKNR